MDLTKIKNPKTVEGKDLKPLLEKKDTIVDVMFEILARLIRLEAKLDAGGTRKKKPKKKPAKKTTKK
jgi:hypothetical protein